MTFAFAAAGTGGHVYPALAVADALVAAGVSRSDIVFFGGDRMEATTVPAAGYDFHGVEIKGLRRSLTADNLKLPAMVRRATREIESEMRKRKVRAVAVFGGYVSVPVASAGRRVGAAVYLHEQNAVPGLANRVVAVRATRSYVAFPDARRRLRKARVVGNPLRAQLASFDRQVLRPAALARYELPSNRPVLGVIGGSLGAQLLNEVTMRIAGDADPGSLAIVHLTGPAHISEIVPIASRSAVIWRAHAFEEAMEYFYAASDVVLSRSGALTISELAATGTPAVAVPYAAGTGGHQGANARQLERAGGVVVIDETDIDRVPVELQQLLMDDSRRSAMARDAYAVGIADAADTIARDLIEVVDG
jgi:UDP-N-acetylglucosamine--N-acetylmuramyl-(pentapeptide) pyrophosphoryl-undecaprenol N-acetylglucosamine transferase